MPAHDYTFIGEGANPRHQTLLRRVLSLSVLGFFLVFLLARGISRVAEGDVGALDLEAFSSGKKGMPDFGQYVHSRTLRFDESSAQEVNRRTIFVGDVHGQSYSLQDLLNTTSYDPTHDTLIHVGDLIAKGTRAGSSQVLDYVVEHDTIGVRGNHDQKVIEWRGWQEWIGAFDGGKEWMEKIEKRWKRKHGEFVGEEDESKELRKGVDPEEVEGMEAEDEDEVDAAGKKQRKERRKRDKKFWSLVPSSWKIFSEHYLLARDLTSKHYDYLRSLPLILHIPSEHAFVVHAGMMPYDITKKIDGPRQPLARIPRVHGGAGSVDEIREKQEVGVLERVPQNNDPWALINMRNVLHDHSIISNTKHGRAWYSIWNQLMPKCAGFNVSTSSEHNVHQDKWLPCEPMSVIYGHTASRGLDVHRWTLGLDSGCVYGRRLSALVLGGDGKGVSRRRKNDDGDDEEEDREDDDEWEDDAEDVEENGHGNVKFGDEGHGRIVSVSCHKHRQKGSEKGDEDRR
ncbi:Metallo-dependent phosphatase [Peniophora sp. CONT]|nr:Metallo-dependent phosphatase [Peniophora sp. CONT]